MGVLNVITTVMTQKGFPYGKEQKPAVQVLSPDEFDRLYPGMLSGMDREELSLLRRRLSVTKKKMNADNDPGAPEQKAWEERMDKLEKLMGRIDKMLEADAE